MKTENKLKEIDLENNIISKNKITMKDVKKISKKIKKEIGEDIRKENLENKKIKITKEMLMAEILEMYPKTETILKAYGLHCVGCFASEFDTLEQGALVHGMPEKEIENLVKDLNRIVENYF